MVVQFTKHCLVDSRGWSIATSMIPWFLQLQDPQPSWTDISRLQSWVCEVGGSCSQHLRRALLRKTGVTTIADFKLALFGVGPNVELRSVAHGCLEALVLGMSESKHGFDQVLQQRWWHRSTFVQHLALKIGCPPRKASLPSKMLPASLTFLTIVDAGDIPSHQRPEEGPPLAPSMTAHPWLQPHSFSPHCSINNNSTPDVLLYHTNIFHYHLNLHFYRTWHRQKQQQFKWTSTVQHASHTRTFSSDSITDVAMCHEHLDQQVLALHLLKEVDFDSWTTATTTSWTISCETYCAALRQ